MQRRVLRFVRGVDGGAEVHVCFVLAKGTPPHSVVNAQTILVLNALTHTIVGTNCI